MIVYHGSYMEIPNPDTVHSRIQVDFGQGFYVTSIQEQAERFTEKHIRRGRSGIVSIYELEDMAFVQSKSLVFDSYSEEWLDFVAACRKSRDFTDYEIIKGGVANDKVFDTVELYFDGLISKEEALGRLVYEKPNEQICIRSQVVLDRYLHFQRSIKL